MNKRLTRLEKMAHKIIKRHKLKLEQVSAPNDFAQAIVQSPASGRKGYEIYQWVKAYRDELKTDYPIERAYWLEAFRDALMWDGKIANLHDWLSAYKAILGQPYPDYPEELSWRSLVHEVWLDRSREWRGQWEVDYIQYYKQAQGLDVFIGATSQQWEGWRAQSFLFGMKAVEEEWFDRAYSDMNTPLSNREADVLYA